MAAKSMQSSAALSKKWATTGALDKMPEEGSLDGSKSKSTSELSSSKEEVRQLAEEVLASALRLKQLLATMEEEKLQVAEDEQSEVVRALMDLVDKVADEPINGDAMEATQLRLSSLLLAGPLPSPTTADQASWVATERSEEGTQTDALPLPAYQVSFRLADLLS